MDHTIIDLRQQDPNLDRAPDPLDEAPLADSPEQVYEARMRAVVHGAATVQVRAAQVLAHLEQPCLEERRLHRLTRVGDVDPSYYLG
ncbi:MAG: hypothetical protein ABI899_00720 [Actinomycetota bacterium]